MELKTFLQKYHNKLIMTFFCISLILLVLQAVTYSFFSKEFLSLQFPAIGGSKTNTIILLSTLSECFIFLLLSMSLALFIFFETDKVKTLIYNHPNKLLFSIFAIYFVFRLTFLFFGYDIADGYEKTAIHFFETKSIKVFHARNIGYPLFILFSTLIYPSFSVVSLFHSFLGMLTAYFLYLSFLNINKMTVASFFNEKKWIVHLTGYLIVIIYLFSTQRIWLEQKLRPEIGSQFLLSLIIYLILRLIQTRSFISYLLLTVTNLFALNYQPKFLIFSIFCIITATIFFCIEIYRALNTAMSKVLKITGIIGIFIVYVAFTNFCTKVIDENKADTKKFAYSTVFVSIMNLVDIELQRDIKKENSKFPKELLKQWHDFYETVAYKYTDMNIKKLDSILYNTPKYGELLNVTQNVYGNGDINYLNDFLKFYCIKSALSHPFAYIYKVIKVYFKSFILLFDSFKNPLFFQDINNKGLENNITSMQEQGNGILQNNFCNTITKILSEKRFYCTFNFFPMIFIYLITVIIFPIWIVLSIITFCRCKKNKALFIYTIMSFLIYLLVHAVTALTTFEYGRYNFELFPIILISCFLCIQTFFLNLTNCKASQNNI